MITQVSAAEKALNLLHYKGHEARFSFNDYFAQAKKYFRTLALDPNYAMTAGAQVKWLHDHMSVRHNVNLTLALQNSLGRYPDDVDQFGVYFGAAVSRYTSTGPDHGVGSKRKVSEVDKRKGNKGSNGNSGRKGKYDPNVSLPVLEGQKITDPWQIPNWNKLNRDAKNYIIKFRRNLGKKTFHNLDGKKKIAAVKLEDKEDTTKEVTKKVLSELSKIGAGFVGRI